VDIKHLGKYLRRSREKFSDAICLNSSWDSDDYDSMMDYMLKQELEAGVQTIQYQINTLMTTNGQSPFVTLFLNLEEDDEYAEETAMIIDTIPATNHLPRTEQRS
jgi:ribonucleoside-triphosphate reductase